MTEVTELTTQEFDYSWLHSNSAKVALIKGGREIQKKATDHAVLTMDLAKAYFEQKKRLLNAAIEECGRADALAQELNEANYSLEDLHNETAVQIGAKWKEWCESDDCPHAYKTVRQFVQYHTRLGMNFEADKLANLTDNSLRALAREKSFKSRSAPACRLRGDAGHHHRSAIAAVRHTRGYLGGGA